VDRRLEAGRRAGSTTLKWMLPALGLGTWAVLVALWGRWGYDDPYITYRYAQNVLSGHGLVYNQGERILSTTAPLYAVLLAGLGGVWTDLPALSNAIGALATVLGAAAMALWAWDRRGVAMVCALLLTWSPLLLTTLGAESCLYLAFTLAGFCAYYRSRLFLAACLLAVAAMLRPDAILAALAAAFVHLIRRRAPEWKPLLLYCALVGAFYAALWLYYGSPIPVTLAAKQKQGQMAISQSFAAGLVDTLWSYLRQPRYWPHALLAMVGALHAARKVGPWGLLLTWSAAYVVAIAALGVSRYPWYYAPLVPALVMLLAEGVAAVAHAVRGLGLSRSVRGALVAVLVVGLWAPLLSDDLLLTRREDTRLEAYLQVGRWLERNTPDSSTVGALEVGIIGYYSQRTMVDFAGLLQPDVAQQLAPEGTYQDSARWAIEHYRPDYVAVPEADFAGLTASPWFVRDYTRLRVFGSGDAVALSLYQRQEAP